MANNLTISAAAKQAALDAVTAQLNVGGAGSIKIYSGAQPTTPDTALSGNTLLVSLTFSATSFGATNGSGVATANAITSGTAGANGTAAWARLTNAAGTAVIDCTVGTASTDIVLGSVAITSGLLVALSAFTLTHP